MARVSPIWTRFNTGELSPLMEGRIDTDKYGSGLHYCVNFIPTTLGPMRHRPGFAFDGFAATPEPWIFRFVFNTAIAYVLEFTPGKVRFWRPDGSAVMDGPDIYEVESPYDAGDLTADDGSFGLDIAQSGDVLYVFNENHHPRTLSRYGETDWRMEALENTGGPWQDQNTTRSIKLYADNRNGITFVRSNHGIFNANMVGALIRLEVEDLSTIKPWEAGQRKDAAADWIGERRRSDGKTYRATAAGSADVPTGGTTLKYVRTGGNKPTHTEGRQWDGEDAQIITGGDYFKQGVEWEYEDCGYGVAKIIEYVSATLIKVVVQQDFPLSVIGGAGAATGTWAFVGDGTTNVFTITGATSDDESQYLIIVDDRVLEIYEYTTDAATDALTILARDPVTGEHAAPAAGVAISVVQLGTPTGTNGLTYRYEIGAWCLDNEYPSKGCFYKNRLWAFGRRTAYASVNDDFPNFADKDFGEVLPGSAITKPLFVDEANSVTWVRPGTWLLVGTTGGVLQIRPNTSNEPIGPANVNVDLASEEGTAPVKPVKIGGNVLYIPRDGRHLSDLYYDFGTDSFSIDDRADLQEHIFDARVQQMAWAASPDRVLWMVCPEAADGYRLIGFTYNKKQEVFGLHRHQLGGDGIPLSVAVVPNDSGQDVVFLAVQRVIDGVTVATIEHMALADTTGRVPIAAYADCHVTYSGVATTTLPAAHLPNTEVSIMGPLWTVQADVTTDGSGDAEVDTPTTYAIVGLYAPAAMAPMRAEAGAMDGTAQGKKQRISGMVARFLDTIGGTFGPDLDTQDPFTHRTPSSTMGASPGLFTGDTEPVVFQGDSTREARVFIVQPQPLPMTIVCLMPVLETER